MKDVHCGITRTLHRYPVFFTITHYVRNRRNCGTYQWSPPDNIYGPGGVTRARTANALRHALKTLLVSTVAPAAVTHMYLFVV